MNKHDLLALTYSIDSHHLSDNLVSRINSYDSYPYITSYSLFLHLCKDGYFRYNDSSLIRHLCRRQLDKLKPLDTVFLVLEELSSFYSDLQGISFPITLIVGRSDESFDNRFLFLVNDRRISHIFAQNNEIIDHPKVTSIPLGLENVGWVSLDNPTNRIDLLNQSMKKSLPFIGSTNKILSSFNVESNYTKRHEALLILKKLDKSRVTLYEFPSVHDATSQSLFYLEIAKHQFTACPHGNGVDTHRLWQTLYLGGVPITVWHPVFSSFQDLGILFIQCWQELDTLDLDLMYKQLIFQRNLDKLTLRYWFAYIKRVKQELGKLAS